MTAVFGCRTGYGIKCALVLLVVCILYIRGSCPVFAAQIYALALPVFIIRNGSVSVNIQLDLSGNIGIFSAVIMDYQLIGTARNIGSARVPSNLTVFMGKEVGRLAVHRKAVIRVEIARQSLGKCYSSFASSKICFVNRCGTVCIGLHLDLCLQRLITLGIQGNGIGARLQMLAGFVIKRLVTDTSASLDAVEVPLFKAI